MVSSQATEKRPDKEHPRSLYVDTRRSRRFRDTKAAETGRRRGRLREIVVNNCRTQSPNARLSFGTRETPFPPERPRHPRIATQPPTPCALLVPSSPALLSSSSSSLVLSSLLSHRTSLGNRKLYPRDSRDDRTERPERRSEPIAVALSGFLRSGLWREIVPS